MPFTLAHPAAAVPLCRPLGRYGVLSALIVGSVTPDVWYLIPFAISRNQTHDFAGLFWFCVPAGCALYLLFHLILKHPLVSLLPAPIANRLSAYIGPQPALPRAPWIAVVLSVSVGATTHVVLDSFTHSQGPLAREVPLLGYQLFSIGQSQVHVSTLFQYSTGIGGVVLLAWWFWRWLSVAPASACAGMLTPRTRSGIALALLAAALAAGVAGDLRASSNVSGPHYSLIRAYVRPALSPALQALAAGVIAYSLIWQMFALRSRRKA